MLDLLDFSPLFSFTDEIANGAKAVLHMLKTLFDIPYEIVQSIQGPIGWMITTIYLVGLLTLALRLFAGTIGGLH